MFLFQSNREKKKAEKEKQSRAREWGRNDKNKKSETNVYRQIQALCFYE